MTKSSISPVFGPYSLRTCVDNGAQLVQRRKLPVRRMRLKTRLYGILIIITGVSIYQFYNYDDDECVCAAMTRLCPRSLQVVQVYLSWPGGVASIAPLRQLVGAQRLHFTAGSTIEVWDTCCVCSIVQRSFNPRVLVSYK